MDSDIPGGAKSRDGSPRMPRPRSEEIPLEDMASSSSQDVDDSSLPLQDPTSQSNSPSISSSGQQVRSDFLLYILTVSNLARDEFFVFLLKGENMFANLIDVVIVEK
jgi:hypothetical protein